MTNTKVFDVFPVGVYPYEVYRSKPVSFTLSNLPPDFSSIYWNQLDGSSPTSPVSRGSLITRSYINYHRNPLNNVADFYTLSAKNFITYDNNVTYLPQNNKYTKNLSTAVSSITSNIVRYIESIDLIQLNNTSNLYYNVSSIRSIYKTPYDFNFFYVQLNDITLNSYGYVVYPSRLFLRPISITNDNGKWQIITKVKVLSSSTLFIQSTSIERDVFASHTTRLNTSPTNDISLPSNLNGNTINFYLSASRTKIDYPAITFPSNTPNTPAFSAIDLESDDIYIHPDSTFMSFSATFYDTNNNVYKRLAQTQRDLSYLHSAQAFSPTYILRYDPTVNTKQIFQFIQGPLDGTTKLSNTNNCVLSATLDINNGVFNLWNGYTPAKISFNNNSFIGVDYILDAATLQGIGTRAIDTLTNKQITLSATNGNTNVGIFNTLNVSDITNNNIIFETTSPPYCYTYKVVMSDNSGKYLDSANLNFYLKLSALNTDVNTVTLSAFFASDFICQQIPIQSNDYISYKVIDTSLTSITDFIKNVVCIVNINGIDSIYDLNASPPIQASSGATSVKIVYNASDYGAVNFSLRGTVYTDSGTIDSYETADITFSTPTQINGNKIFTNILNEDSNTITIDSSFNISASSWPSRDLRDSYISWDWYNNTTGLKDLPLTFNYVDINGNSISTVTPKEAVIFSSNTWQVNLQGYGPNQIVISLSSQKYSETATLSTHPNLFNFLTQKQLVVGPASNLKNLDLTRTINLTAAIPYGNQIYTIPSTIPINWTWEYDGIVDPIIQPITVNPLVSSNLPYNYSTNLRSNLLSAIKVNVTPPYSKTTPKLHTVKMIASINIVQPPISGYYIFRVDDFPDPSIFNSDFNAYYADFVNDKNYNIGNTRNGNNTITRPKNSNLSFTFSANNDIIPTIIGSNINWTINGISTGVTTNNYNINLNTSAGSLSAYTLNGLNVTSAKIGLNLNSGIAPGWTSAHNVSASMNVFLLESVDFNDPLKFIIYPEYAWFTGDTLLTLLSTNPNDISYYTNAYMPSAYANKRSNSQTFWVSANKNSFNDYIYQNQQNYAIMSTVSSFALIDIPYNQYDVSVIAGLPISLIAYNDSFYPENINTSYLIEMTTTQANAISANIFATNGSNCLVTQYYNITAHTKDKTKPTSAVFDNFFLSPVVLPYNDLELNFNIYCNGIPNTSLNLLSGGLISVSQNLQTIPFGAPAVAVGGNITYYLSSKFWSVSASAPYVNGYYDLFNLKIGDPSVPLYSGGLGEDEFYLYAVPNTIQQITSATFANYYGTSLYPINGDLWLPITPQTVQ
jgi:hypothetical protein